MKNLFTAFIVSIVSMFILAGCQTMEGFGDDVKKVGDDVEDATDN